MYLLCHIRSLPECRSSDHRKLLLRQPLQMERPFHAVLHAVLPGFCSSNPHPQDISFYLPDPILTDGRSRHPEVPASIIHNKQDQSSSSALPLPDPDGLHYVPL